MSNGMGPRQSQRNENPLVHIGSALKCDVWRTPRGISICRVVKGSWPGCDQREERIDLTPEQAAKVHEFLGQALETRGGAA